MENNTTNIIDTGLSSFHDDVIQASQDSLVMVDFWASWCGPCRSLAPILEKLVGEYGDEVKLAKVNTDEHQELAGQYGIRSLPTVYFFHKGEIVEQFMGVQPESIIKGMIDKYVASQLDLDLESIKAVYEAGDSETAESKIQGLIIDYPSDDRPKLLFMEWLSAANRCDEAKTIAESISKEGQSKPEFKTTIARLEFAKTQADLPSEEVLEQLIAENENDLEARFKLANKLAGMQQYEGAMDQFIEIIKRDRRFNDDAPRQSLLKIFELLGGKGELVSKYRGLLARTLN